MKKILFLLAFLSCGALAFSATATGQIASVEVTGPDNYSFRVYLTGGSQFFYVNTIDANYNNQIENLDYTDFQTTNAPMTGVCVYSLGKDGQLGSTKPNTGSAYRMGSNVSDDIVSWQ